MPYNSAIPQPTDRPSQSQPQILGNFSEIATAFNLNHVDFNATGEGKHKFLQMPDQVSAPVTAVNEGAIYVKSVAGTSQLFWRNENSGVEVQLTGSSVTSSANGGSAGGTIYKWFIAGLTVYFGVTSSIGGGGVTKTIIFPNAYTTVYTVVAAINDSNPVSVGATWTTTTVTLKVSDGVSGVTFIAIGII